jgi:hypothetical protein
MDVRVKMSLPGGRRGWRQGEQALVRTEGGFGKHSDPDFLAVRLLEKGDQTLYDRLLGSSAVYPADLNSRHA